MNPKLLFLIDGIGALVSAFFLGFVLVQLRHLIGMPEHILYYLALVPCFFAVYSFGCYYFLKGNRPAFLKVIAICNLLYCVITAVLVYCYFDNLTTLGLFYFIMEIVIILVLVRVELRSASSNLAEGSS